MIYNGQTWQYTMLSAVRIYYIGSLPHKTYIVIVHSELQYQWRIQGGGVAGVATPVNFQKRAVSSMAVVIDLVVTSCWPDFPLGPFQHCPLEDQHVVCNGWTGTDRSDIEVRRYTFVRSCSWTHLTWHVASCRITTGLICNYNIILFYWNDR